MPNGKPASTRCAQLDGDNRCLVFGRPERPAVCSQLRPSPEVCGADAASATRYLARLEVLTQPSGSQNG